LIRPLLVFPWQFFSTKLITFYSWVETRDMEKVTGYVTSDTNFGLCLALQSRTESRREVWERSLYCCYQFSCDKD